MVVPKGINGLDTPGAVLRRDFIQPVEQRQDGVGRYPCLADLPRHVVLLAEGIDEPVCQGALLLSPRRERKHHRDELLGVVAARISKSRTSVSSNVVLPAPWGTEDEQGVVEAIKDVDETRARRLHVVGKVRALHVECPRRE